MEVEVENVDKVVDDTKTIKSFDGLRLCGWLTKNSDRPQSRLFAKSRWFVYGADSCKLYYYRRPDDLLPLGEIDIYNASFSFEANETEKPGQFEIRSNKKLHILEAPDRNTMLYWLQALQQNRRTFSELKVSLSKDRVGQWTTKKSLGGLVGEKKTHVHAPLQSTTSDITIAVEPCHNLIGENAINQQPEQKSPIWSLTNLRKELRNTMASLKINKQLPSGSNPSSPGHVNGDDWMLLDADDSSSSITSALAPCIEITDVGSSSSETESMGSNSSIVQAAKPEGRFMSAFKIKKSRKPRASEAKVDQNAMDISAPQVVQKFSTCQKCKQMEYYVISLKDDLQVSDTERQTSREVMKLLQREVDRYRKEIQTRDEAAEASDKAELLEMLKKNDHKMVELEFLLDATNDEKEHCQQSMRYAQEELKSSVENNTMFQRMVEAKDEVIVKLTNQIFELENSHNDAPSAANENIRNSAANMADTLNALANAREIEDLKDTCRAYEMQNKFLTKEILELNELRQHDQEREKMLLMDFTQTEALYYQTRSKYLFLLKELEDPIRGGDEGTSQEVVSQLLQAALEGGDASESRDILQSGSAPEYDRYGFLKITEVDHEEDQLVARASLLQRQSDEINNKIKEVDQTTSVHVKWENYFANQDRRQLVRNPELKLLVRQGIPHEYRERMWKWCIECYVGTARTKLGLNYYKATVEKAKNNKTNPAAKQIELDLLRTLPTNTHYDHMERDGISKLRRVLLAYSIHNPWIGYCQGLNRLVAIALLFLTEEDAFWCLITIVDHVMPPDYFSKTLLGAQTDQRVLKDLIQEKLPRLSSHMEEHKVDLSLFTFNWFLTIFVDNVPPETFLRIWDAFMYEGSKVLFRFAIAFFKVSEEHLLTQSNSIEIHRYLRCLSEKMTNTRRVAQIAFNELNPFPMRSIASKRQFYMQHVKAELAELDALREVFRSSQVPRDRADVYISDEEL